jgi:hypothetical protein
LNWLYGRSMTILTGSLIYCDAGHWLWGDESEQNFAPCLLKQASENKDV